ncbi:unnamed protein product, partial [Prorocentrum cordatum]
FPSGRASRSDAPCGMRRRGGGDEPGPAPPPEAGRGAGDGGGEEGQKRGGDEENEEESEDEGGDDRWRGRGPRGRGRGDKARPGRAASRARDRGGARVGNRPGSGGERHLRRTLYALPVQYDCFFCDCHH